MRCGKLASATFLLLLTGVALASVQPGTGVGTAQLGQEQEKLCLNCHSPRFPPNDTSHEHTGLADHPPYAFHDPGSPCYACHGDTEDPTYGDPTHNPDNIAHPNVTEAAAVGKDLLNCSACHYPHNIQEELQAGSITAPPPPPEPTLTTWALMAVAGVSLITGISVIGVLLSVRKRKQTTVGS